MRPRLLTATMAVLSILAAVAHGAAAMTTNSETVKATLDMTGVVLTCPDESVAFSGVAKLVETGTTTPSGHATTVFVLNLSGITAFGQSSGRQYRATGVTVSGFATSSSGTGSATTSRFVQTWLLVPLAEGAPLSFHEVLSLTYNATGELVSVASEGPSDCD